MKARNKIYSSFFVTVAAAWYTAGTVTPFFTQGEFLEKLGFVLVGIIGAGIYLEFSIRFSKGV